MRTRLYRIFAILFLLAARAIIAAEIPKHDHYFIVAPDSFHPALQ